MRLRSLLRGPLALCLTIPVAAALMPLSVSPTEAGRIKFRFRSGAATTHVSRTDNGTRAQTGSPFSIRVYGNSSSGSASATADGQDKRGLARVGDQDRAAAAAERARAALEAEAASRAAAAPLYEPIPIGKTTSYSNGVTCVAGC